MSSLDVAVSTIPAQQMTKEERYESMIDYLNTVEDYNYHNGMFIFSRALTKRITELAKATRIVSEGDYDHRIPVAGHDELSELGTEFNSLTARLKETEELRRRFVSDASHELKTPLASIRLLSDSIVNSENMVLPPVVRMPRGGRIFLCTQKTTTVVPTGMLL